LKVFELKVELKMQYNKATYTVWYRNNFS